MVKKGILLVSFGTAAAEAWEKTLGLLAGEVRESFPDVPVYEAITSPTIRQMWAKRGWNMPDVPGALEEMAAHGVEAVTVLPTFLIAGMEYQRLVLDCGRRAERFSSFLLAPPLLDRPQELVRVAEILLERQSPLPEDTALVLMGHGTNHRGDFAYGAMDCVFRELGQPNVFVATVEGYLGLEGLKKRLEERTPRRVILRPLLLTAGEHARSDMAGEDESSWKNVLIAAGYQVDCVLEGLGEIPAIRQMYLERLASPGC